MRNKVIAYLEKLRKDNEPHADGEDPIANEELLDFEIHQDLNQHTDEELIEILAAWGVFEG